MKPAGYLIFVPVGLGLIAAAEPTPARLSARISAEIRASLPLYVAPVASAKPEPDAPAADPNVVVLPKIVIQEKRPPGNDPDVWLSPRRVQQKALAAYKGSMTDLEWVLNSWFIPLFSAPPSVRARAAYQSAKAAAENDRLGNIITAIAVDDPAMAARLRRAMDPGRLP
jgi:hypothetical protein